MLALPITDRQTSWKLNMCISINVHQLGHDNVHASRPPDKNVFQAITAF